MKKNKFFRHFTICMAFLFSSTILAAETVGLFYDSSVEQIKFAAGDVKAALESKGYTVDVQSLTSLNSSYANKKVVLALAANNQIASVLLSQGGKMPTGLGDQAYGIRTTTSPKTSYWVFGGNTNGAMYGGFQIAENIKFNQFTNTYNNQESPSLIRRGIKLNLPFDKVSDTYGKAKSEMDNFRINTIKDVWDYTFWTTWLDEMARNRYNVLSIWSNHPFTSMIKMADYPDVAIKDVTGPDGVVIKTMTIDEKIVYWKKVMAYAHARGFEFYLFNWNIWTGGAETKTYSITEDNATAAKDSETINYMRKCMTTLIETYPDLDGFGITQGEHMSANEADNALFLAKTYGQGVVDFAKTNSTRKFRFIHRWFLADLEAIKINFKDLLLYPNITFDMSFKYCIGHMYSSTTPGYMSDEDKSALVTSKMNSFLTLRNDDFYMQSWGNPEFAREFIANMPGQGTWLRGFYMGSDGYQPTRMQLSKNNLTKDMLEVQRQWYMFMIWGRLTYNPATPDYVFKNYMASKFPGVNAVHLFTAWKKASRSLPKVTELIQNPYRGDDDWYPEICQRNPNKTTNYTFITADHFAAANVSTGSALCSFAKTAANVCGTKKGTFTIADEIEKDALSALSIVGTMTAAPNTTLELALNNIKTLSYLSMYYAYKIKGASYVAANDNTKAKDALGTAYCWWMKYTNLMDKMYNGVPLVRNASFTDWHVHDASVLKEYNSKGGIGTPNCDITSTIPAFNAAVDIPAFSEEQIVTPIEGPTSVKELVKDPIELISYNDKTMTLQLPINDAYTLRIIGIDGKKITEIKGQSSADGINTISLGRNLLKGVYILEIKMKKASLVKQIKMV